MSARTLLLFVIGLAVVVSSADAQKTPNPAEPLVYPETRTVDQVDVLHGERIADPYRWLEDLDSPETAAWVAAQNKVTFGYLEAIPARDKIRQRITDLYNFEKYGLPYKEGGRYFFSKNDGLQPQFVIYVADTLAGRPRVLLDPNKLSEDGTVSLFTYAISEDGKLMAYGLSAAGSDWVDFKVRDVDTGQDLADLVKWTKFSDASWTRDCKGFFYTRFDEPTGDELAEVNRFPKVYYHTIGTPQSADRLVYHRPDEPDWGFESGVTEDGRYLVIRIDKGSERRHRVAYQDLEAGDGKTIDLITEFAAQYEFIGNDGPVFWFFTDDAAPRGRVVAIDTRRPAHEQWVEVIPQAEETLRGAAVVSDKFLAMYLKDAHTVVRVFDLSGKHVRDVELPGIGAAGGFYGKRTDPETFYAYTSFSVPGTIYRYDVQTGASTVFRRPKVDFDPDRYETKQVFYTSKDGTRVPMFITHKRGLKLNGQNPTFLYGYGGFDYAITPRFSVSRLVWMEMGGVYAVANIRGGGEYGKTWHEAGKLKLKQNTFDDFIAAAEWLIANRYTCSEKLAISGASNGGLLVGACMTQRPDLFGACLPSVGVLDMLRFHLFTIGWAWKSDYGDPEDPEDFKVLLAYSPLHNIKAGTCYPATLAMTADHDDRVVPVHSFKFISALQKAQGCDHPILIRIETRAGHGSGKPTQKIIEEISDEYAFLVRVFGMDTTSLDR